MSKEKGENLIEQFETEDKPNIQNYEERKKKHIIKGISSIISCIFHTCGFYSVFILGHTVVYLISFRRHYNPNITFSHGYFLFPIMYFIISLTIPLGGVVEEMIGGKKTMFVSSLILCLSFSVMYFSRNLFIDYILMSFIGLGIAFGIKITKRNACSYFMKRKALISGIVTLIPSFVSAGLVLFYEKHILNPLSESPTIDHMYYEEKIFINFQKLLIYEILFLILVGVLSLFTFYENDRKETIRLGFGEEIKMKRKLTEILKEEKSISKIKIALTDKRPYIQFIMLFFFFPTINFIQNIWRPIGIYYKIKTQHLQLIGALSSITGALSSIFFSLIGDKINFKYLFALSGLLLSITSFVFPTTFTKDILFIIAILIIYFVLNGFNITIDPHLMKIYGIDHFVVICGIIRASSGIAEIVSISFAFYLENYFTGNKDYAYKHIYIISGCSSFISFILGLFESDEKFDYNNNNNNKSKKMSEDFYE